MWLIWVFCLFFFAYGCLFAHLFGVLKFLVLFFSIWHLFQMYSTFRPCVLKSAFIYIMVFLNMVFQCLGIYVWWCGGCMVLMMVVGGSNYAVIKSFLSFSDVLTTMLHHVFSSYRVYSYNWVLCKWDQMYSKKCNSLFNIKASKL